MAHLQANKFLNSCKCCVTFSVTAMTTIYMNYMAMLTNIYHLLPNAIWILLGCGEDVIVIGGRAGVVTLNKPTAGCCWLVVYSHCHLSMLYRENNFSLLFLSSPVVVFLMV